MFPRISTALVAMVLLTTASVFAAPKLSPKAQGPEIAFIRSIQKDLNARFATPAQAEKAGYFRYTNEDNTGAISYANLQWQSSDPQHPSQLWYDVHGNLLGADFSILRHASTKAPSLWGVNPARWEKIPAHVHWVLVGPNDAYGHATSTKKFAAAGGNLANPQAATVVKLGKVKNAAQVRYVFLLPAIWDIDVWVKHNPNGAFADKNPLVIPSANAAHSMM